MSAQDDAFRLRKAKELLADCKIQEDEARRTLAEKSETTKMAREKYQALFREVEMREFARRKEAAQ